MADVVGDPSYNPDLTYEERYRLRKLKREKKVSYPPNWASHLASVVAGPKVSFAGVNYCLFGCVV